MLWSFTCTRRTGWRDFLRKDPQTPTNGGHSSLTRVHSIGQSVCFFTIIVWEGHKIAFLVYWGLKKEKRPGMIFVFCACGYSQNWVFISLKSKCKYKRKCKCKCKCKSQCKSKPKPKPCLCLSFPQVSLEPYLPSEWLQRPFQLDFQLPLWHRHSRALWKNSTPKQQQQ